METNQRRRSTIFLLAILLIGLYLATVTVDPVFATNVDGRLKPKTYDKGIKIDNSNKDKLKVTSQRWGPEGNGKTTSSVISTMSLSTLRPPRPLFNLTG